ncbi:MAG: glycosyltransferase family 4 protein [Oscillospiraceae bacterium]|nr:glycosyltransferase family 4 protein [Oscillospiraceae bacterium]
MKLLILANFDVGLYQFRQELLQRLLSAGHEVTIALPDGDLVRPLEEMGCTFVDTPLDRRGINPVTDGKLLLRYRRLLRQVRPDLVISYTIKPNIYGGLACRAAGVPFAANITGLGTAFQKQGALRTLVTIMYKTALKKAKVVFFENAGNRDTLLEMGIVRPEQCCLLMGAGVNLQRFAAVDYPAEEPTRFLFVGRLMREKGVDELFAAMARLHDEGAACTLDVLGEMEEDYSAAVAAGEQAGWLRYHGYQTDVRPFVAAGHCFVLPSYHEGMANTNLECAAMARPVITSDIPGCREAVEEGVSGLLCAPQDAESLYAAMKRFLALPMQERAAMGAAGRRRMEAIFDKEKVVNATLEGLGL